MKNIYNRNLNQNKNLNQKNNNQIIKNYIWNKNFNINHIQNIKNIHFYIHPNYENDLIIKYQLQTLIQFFRFIFLETFNITLITSNTIYNNFDTLYILLNHRELHNFIGIIPNIFVLVNTLDLYDNSFIFQQNILLYSKAYKIIDLKYINLKFYINEVKSYTYYLPLISNYNNIKPYSVKECNDILFYKNNTQRSMIIYKLLCKKLEAENKYSFQLYDDEELFHESKIIVRINDDHNSYYDNILFHKCIYHNKICISEKCDDIYNENYYFDKIIFENKINILDENTLNNFINKIKLYLEDNNKINILKSSMNKENYQNNINQFKLIFDKL